MFNYQYKKIKASQRPVRPPGLGPSLHRTTRWLAQRVGPPQLESVSGPGQILRVTPDPLHPHVGTEVEHWWNKNTETSLQIKLE
jgi:hypothetical protein